MSRFWIALALVSFVGLAQAEEADRAIASDETDTVSDAARRKIEKLGAKKSGADSEEGWIIKKTKDGYIKVPRKQTFVFKGSEVSGAANRPSQTILGQRPVYRKATLIPERASFRREYYEASGYSAGRSE